MIDHTGIHVADLSRSKRFYEPVLAALGYVLRRDIGSAVGYGKEVPGPFDDPGGEFYLIEGAPLVPRIHIAFRARSRQSVDAFYRAALASGGTDNGAGPAPRLPPALLRLLRAGPGRLQRRGGLPRTRRLKAAGRQGQADRL